MPVEFAWDNPERTIMRLRAVETWDWNLFHKTHRRMSLRYDEVTHPVELIIDFRKSERFPGGTIAHIRSLGTAFHANAPARAVILGVSVDMQRAIGARGSVYQDDQRKLVFGRDDRHALSIIEGWRLGKEGY
jgi:hypothetical protein